MQGTIDIEDVDIFYNLRGDLIEHHWELCGGMHEDNEY